MRGRVIAAVRGKLRTSGLSLDGGDLEACYAQAWQGLYAALLEGQDIANPAGWLVLVTYRRAIEEHRARLRVERASDPSLSGTQTCHERDIAAELDDRAQLRSLFEGFRGKLNDREREAAVLCYLQGLSRSEAAARMGVSETRMRKLMEGRGAGRPGVAGKVGALVETIRSGGWCEEQGSLMRGLAYGLLDPDGERHRLALLHCDECPACRAYVSSLRGLAAALPPVLLPWGVGAGLLAGAGGIGRAGLGGGSAAAGAAPGVAAAGAGGGWMLTGGAVGAKLAAGCLLTLTIGAGCIALGQGHASAPRDAHGAHRAAARAAAARPEPRLIAASAPLPRPAAAASPAHTGPHSSLAPAARADREFGLESRSAPAASQETSRAQSSARAAATRPAASTSAAKPAALAAAAREFSPG